MGFGERIVSARKAAGLTQKALAEQMGSTGTRISLWEKEAREPDVAAIKKMSVQITDLLIALPNL